MPLLTKQHQTVLIGRFKLCANQAKRLQRRRLAQILRMLPSAVTPADVSLLHYCDSTQKRKVDTKARQLASEGQHPWLCKDRFKHLFRKS